MRASAAIRSPASPIYPHHIITSVKHVMFSPLSHCPQDTSESYECAGWKFGGMVGGSLRMSWFNLGSDREHIPHVSPEEVKFTWMKWWSIIKWTDFKNMSVLNIMDTSVECTIAVGELDNILVDPQLIILTFGVMEACTLRSAFPLFKMSSCPEGIRTLSSIQHGMDVLCIIF